jgi:hypothetical protein
VTIARLLLGVIIVLGSACSALPTTPTPPNNPPPDPGPAVQNAPPTIGAFTVQGTRAGQPGNFADLGETINVGVTVTDPETAITSLVFNWSATAGTFTGTGPAVTWRAPSAAIVTPVDIVLSLEVLETYRSQGRDVQNRVAGSTTVSLHNSIQEVAELAVQFLMDFSDSALGVTQVMRNFEPGCYGTQAEFEQVADNRENFTIIESKVGTAVTSVGFGGACMFRSRRGDACSRVPVFWRSRAIRDIYDSRGRLYLRKGEIDTASGVDQLAAMYYAPQKRWRLCDSSFDPNSTSLHAEEIRGLVP